METRRRNFATYSASQDAPLCKRVKYNLERLVVDGILLRAPTASDIRSHLLALFGEAPQGIWLRLLPKYDDCDSVWYACGVEWDDMFPSLLDYGLVKYHSTGKLTVCKSTLTGLCDGAHHGVPPIREGAYRRKNSTRNDRYLLFGEPLYRNPEEQENFKSFSIPAPSPTDDAIYLRQFFRLAKMCHISFVGPVSTNVLESSACPPSSLKAPPPSACKAASLPTTDNTAIMAQLPMAPAHATPVHTVIPASNTALCVQWQSLINSGLKLGDPALFAMRPRTRRDGSGAEIVVRENRKQADAEARATVLSLAKSMQWLNSKLSASDRLRIARAACNIVAWDLGYPKPLACTQLDTWEHNFTKAMQDGTCKGIHPPTVQPSKAVLDQVESSHPGYIRELFLYAQGVAGHSASYADLAEVMTAKSAEPNEQRPTLTIHHRQLQRWCKRNLGGK